MVRLAREDSVGPTDVDEGELTTAMSPVVVFSETVDAQQRVASTRTHRAPFNNVSTGCADVPVESVHFGNVGQHIAQHDRTCDVAGTESNKFER
jgi:hypothetical protein